MTAEEKGDVPGKAGILIVEDEMLIARDLKRRLEHWGHDVIDMVRTGTDAVTTSMAKCPDLILMDIQLNGDMDGIEAGEIISHRCDTSIVHVTANTDPCTLERIGQTRSHGLIIKPFSDAEVFTIVERALLRRSMEGKEFLWKAKSMTPIH